jgi:hypothetical protein
MPDVARPIIANVPRLEEYMERHRLAAVVARSGQSVTCIAASRIRHARPPPRRPDTMRGVLRV